MFALPTYRSIVSLIPGGCPQFLDFEFNVSAISKGLRHYLEEAAPGAQAEAGKVKVTLRCLKEDEEGRLCDEMSGQAVREAAFEIPYKKALEPWLDEWLPVPFLRGRDQKWPDGEPRFEYGPSNWSRVRLVRSEDAPDILRVVLIFDMTVEAPPEDTETYFALSPADVEAHAGFRLAWRARDNSWFLNQGWVDRWLRNAWDAFKARRKNRAEDEFSLEYLASYLTMLDVLSRAIQGTEVRVIKPSGPPIDVDLVLDIGNSRTTGILVETCAQRSTNLNDSYLLQLRDLDSPEKVYTDPFETRLEFSEASFGDDNLSRQSGRQTPAFVWPSPVRIGPEAARLSTMALCAEGITGMSSPKRYLWDERDWRAGWRYNTLGGPEPRVTRGPLPRVVNSSGTPLCCMGDKLFRNNPRLRGQERDMAFASNFTRSSLMMFLLVEVLQQALMTINSPGQRGRRGLPDVPRRLRQVIFTVPAGMPIAEQRIYRRWVNWAVQVLWEILGWQNFYVADHKKAAGSEDYRVSPRVRCNWDEATCTQLVYIYNEITKKYQGDAATLCRITGTPRAEYEGKPAVRIATIDIGGGTTDLSITTFVLESEPGSSSRMRPYLELRDGFNIAGDNILREVIKSILLPGIGSAMAESGIRHSDKLINTLFGRDVMDSSQESRNRRAQCARQLLTPAALCILRAYEKANHLSGEGGLTCTLKDFFEGASPGQDDVDWPFERQAPPSPAVIEYIESAARGASRNGDFRLMDVPVRINPNKVDAVIRESMAGVLSNLCEVVQRYDCDMLLLTGRPSRWRGIISTVFAKLPVPPDRILPMGEYRVDAWYPFADPGGVITDPKTTVVVGAILCALAEGHLEGFSFDPSGLVPASTARFIGEMDTNGQIKKNKVWFEVDVSSKAEKKYAQEVKFAGPIAVGFRLLDVERWTTTRFYVIDFADESARQASADKIPFNISLSLTLREMEEDETGRRPDTLDRDEGEFRIEGITDRSGNDVKPDNVEIRLQTLPLDEGVWLDTGIII
jgi:hypothetical protein